MCRFLNFYPLLGLVCPRFGSGLPSSFWLLSLVNWIPENTQSQREVKRITELWLNAVIEQIIAFKLLSLVSETLCAASLPLFTSRAPVPVPSPFSPGDVLLWCLLTDGSSSCFSGALACWGYDSGVSVITALLDSSPGTPRAAPCGTRLIGEAVGTERSELPGCPNSQQCNLRPCPSSPAPLQEVVELLPCRRHPQLGAQPRACPHFISF